MASDARENELHVQQFAQMEADTQRLLAELAPLPHFAEFREEFEELFESLQKVHRSEQRLFAKNSRMRQDVVAAEEKLAEVVAYSLVRTTCFEESGVDLDQVFRQMDL